MLLRQVPDWHVGQCQSGTWRKVGSGELQIATAQATGWRFPGATATCPTGKRVTGG
ncbi:shufflon protein B, partial [Escherichia coli]